VKLPKFINIYTVVFVLGAAVLTAMPLLQRRFLTAPAPLGPMGAWALKAVPGDAEVSSSSETGHVLLATLAPAACDEPCVERSRGLVRALEHTDDLGDVIHLVTFTQAQAAPALHALSKGRYRVLTGSPDALDPVLIALKSAWQTFAGTDAGATVDDFAALPAYVVIDQQGNVRGFWRDDAAGRGNAINAARLLAKHGVKP